MSIAALVKKAVNAHGDIGDIPGTTRIECCYETFQVNVEQALQGKDEFVRLLAQFGEAFSDESLKRGVAYDRVRELVPEDRLSMLEVFAFGKAIGLWQIVTPREKRRNPKLRHINFGGTEIGLVGIIRLET
jgi:hypothetical protein